MRVYYYGCSNRSTLLVLSYIEKVLDKEVLNEYLEQGHVKILWGELWHMDLLVKIGGITVDPTLLKVIDLRTQQA